MMSGNPLYRGEVATTGAIVTPPHNGDFNHSRVSPRIPRSTTPPPPRVNRLNQRDNSQSQFQQGNQHFSHPAKRYIADHRQQQQYSSRENFEWKKETEDAFSTTSQAKRHRPSTPIPVQPSTSLNEDIDYRYMPNAVVPYNSSTTEPRFNAADTPCVSGLEELIVILNYKKEKHEEYKMAHEALYSQELKVLAKISEEQRKQHHEKIEQEECNSRLKTINLKYEEKVKELENEVASLKKGRRDMSSLLQNKQTELEARDKKIKDLDKEVALGKAECGRLGKLHEAGEKVVNDWKAKYDSQCQECQSLQLKNDALVETNTKLKEQEEKSRSEVKRLKALSFRQTGHIEKMIFEVTRRREENKNLETRLLEQKQEALQVTETVNELSRLNSDLNVNLSQHVAENDTRQREVNRLKGIIKELEDQLIQKQKLIDDLETGFLQRQNEIMVASKSTIQWLESRRSSGKETFGGGRSEAVAKDMDVGLKRSENMTHNVATVDSSNAEGVADGNNAGDRQGSPTNNETPKDEVSPSSSCHQTNTKKMHANQEQVETSLITTTMVDHDYALANTVVDVMGGKGEIRNNLQNMTDFSITSESIYDSHTGEISTTNNSKLAEALEKNPMQHRNYWLRQRLSSTSGKLDPITQKPCPLCKQTFTSKTAMLQHTCNTKIDSTMPVLTPVENVDLESEQQSK